MKPKRLLLKLSGEVLRGTQSMGIDASVCERLAISLGRIQKLGVELGVVIGGGNIFRGLSLQGSGIPRTPADQMGMLATLFNGIALQQALIARGSPTHLLSALVCPQVAETYHWASAMRYLKEGAIVLFVGGTGNPYFTTDTAAALRASEIQADALFKATKVDGIYNKDPLQDATAVKYTQLTYAQMLAEKLQVMDATAVTLCCSNHLPIFVFDMQRLFEDDMESVIYDISHGTWVNNVLTGGKSYEYSRSNQN